MLNMLSDRTWHWLYIMYKNYNVLNIISTIISWITDIDRKNYD